MGKGRYPVIRLAQLGIDDVGMASSEDDIDVTTNLEWVEIDGVRIDSAIDAKIEMGDQVNTVTLTLVGRIELVTLLEGDYG